MSQLAQIHIDIVSDVVCPWCIIGYRELERAVGMLGERVEVGVRWHPFQLAPSLPSEGQASRDYMRERYGASPEQSRGNRARLVERGAALGIDFRFSEEGRIYNTLKAHQLLYWAGEAGGQTPLKLALFDAYFTREENIADTEILLAAVARVGLDVEEARAVLAEDRYADAVRKEVEYWQDQNVTGVPAFVINGKYMIPGAQDAETFARVLERVLLKEAT